MQCSRSGLDTFLDSYDQSWVQRKRAIDTKTIFYSLCQSAITKTGISNVLHTIPISSAALCKARQKLPDNIFYNANKELIENKVCLSRIFAVDGSKFYVPASFRSYDFKSRTNDKDVPRKAKRPVAMLSSVVDVYQNVCYDYVVSKHFNERQSVYDHLPRLRADDLLIFDRGYFSHKLYNALVDHKIDAIFRLKLDQFKAVTSFVKSRRSDQQVTTRIANVLVNIRLVKYVVNNKQYILGTSCFDKSRKQLAHLYHKRWNVELSFSFRRLKSNLNLNYTFSLKEKTWLQSVQCRILADTICILWGGTQKCRRTMRLLFIDYRHFICRVRLKGMIYLYLYCSPSIKQAWLGSQKSSYAVGVSSTVPIYPLGRLP